MSAQGVMDAVMRMTGGVQYELPDMNGQLKTVTQAFNDGRLKWEDFQANIQMYGLNVKDTLGAFHEIIYRTFIETRNIALEAGKIPPSIQEFLKENGVNIPQSYINTMTQDRKNTLQNQITEAYHSNKYPELNARIDKEGGIEKYIQKYTGSSGALWWKKENNFPAEDVNLLWNSVLEERAEKEGVAGNRSTPAPTPKKSIFDSYRNMLKWQPTSQSSYKNNYSQPSSNPQQLQAFNNHFDIKINGLGVEDEKFIQMVGREVLKLHNEMINDHRA